MAIDISLFTYEASFKGVPFLMNSHTRDGGKKTVTHEYVNTPRRFIQEFGPLQPKFSMDVITTGDAAEYFVRRDALITALESEGLGILIHPYYGVLTAMSTTFSITEEDSEVGVARFTLNFEVGDAAVYPTESGDQLFKLDFLADTGLKNVADNIGAAINLAKTTVQTALMLKNKINTALALYRTLFNRFTAPVTSAEQLLVALNAASTGVNVLTKSPSKLGNSLSNLFTLSNDYGQTASDRFNIAKTFVNFGNTDVAIEPTTYDLKARKNNMDVINTGMKTMALFQMYRNTPQLEFTTVEEAQSVADTLDAAYADIQNSNGLDNDTYDTLNQARNAATEFFNKATVSLNNVIDLTISDPTPMMLICYNLYGNLNNLATLYTLNPTQNAGFVKGTIKVITNANDT